MQPARSEGDYTWYAAALPARTGEALQLQAPLRTRPVWFRLPEGLVPAPNDDEVERFELWPAARLVEAVRDSDSIKFNVNLVLIDLFLREGLIADPDGALRAGLDQGPD